MKIGKSKDTENRVEGNRRIEKNIVGIERIKGGVR